MKKVTSIKIDVATWKKAKKSCVDKNTTLGKYLEELIKKDAPIKKDFKKNAKEFKREIDKEKYEEVLKEDIELIKDSRELHNLLCVCEGLTVDEICKRTNWKEKYVMKLWDTLDYFDLLDFKLTIKKKDSIL